MRQIMLPKGRNATISLVHHFLENHGLGNDKILLHCVGQNKNNAFIFFLLWRVMTGKEKDITLSFMVAGHKKFSCDRFFGLIKNRDTSDQRLTQYKASL